MKNIDRSAPDQAERLFEIMVRATEVGCSPSYPPEVIAIWHKGRSVEGMLGVIADVDIYTLVDDGIPRGFVHIGDAEVVGLFVHPDDHRKGYGTDLFRFAVDKIGTRPILVLATLNAAPFYSKLGCHKVATELVRRHDHDIYVERMELG
jgi:GNAT superfamily N-acetyltransferase